MLYLLRHLDMLEERPEAFGEDFFSKMFSMAEFSKLSKEERNMYITEAMKLNDYYNTIDYAREKGEEAGIEKGMEKGMKKGRAEGMIQGKIETAKNMKSMGISDEVICKCTGLTLEQVMKL